MNYKIGTLSHKTGISTNLLRAWEQRYGFLRPGRGPGGQRLYSEEDLLLLAYVKKELAGGLRIGELASQGRQTLIAKAKGLASAKAHPVPPTVKSPAPIHELGVRDFVRRLSKAALAVDNFSFQEQVNLAFSCLQPAAIITKIIPPVLEELGRSWQEGEMSIAAEHMASNTLEQKLKALVEARQAATPQRPAALCACFPDEDHRLGLLSVAYFLAGQGLPIVFLGNALPFSDLSHAIGQIQPATVWLSVTRREIFQRHLLGLLMLVKEFPRVRFIIGGQAMTQVEPDLERAGVLQCLQPFSLPEDLLELPLFTDPQFEGVGLGNSLLP